MVRDWLFSIAHNSAFRAKKKGQSAAVELTTRGTCSFANPAILNSQELLRTRGFVPPGHPGFTSSETALLLSILSANKENIYVTRITKYSHVWKIRASNTGVHPTERIYGTVPGDVL